MTTTEAALDTSAGSDGQTVRRSEVPRHRIGAIVVVALAIVAVVFGIRRWRWGDIFTREHGTVAQQIE